MDPGECQLLNLTACLLCRLGEHWKAAGQPGALRWLSDRFKNCERTGAFPALIAAMIACRGSYALLSWLVDVPLKRLSIQAAQIKIMGAVNTMWCPRPGRRVCAMAGCFGPSAGAHRLLSVREAVPASLSAQFLTAPVLSFSTIPVVGS